MTEFLKMHGLGNDFVVFDWRQHPDRQVPPAAARLLADRRHGVGCDQLLVIRPATDADIAMDILNQDGSPSAACGNGTRCVADLVMQDSGRDEISIRTDAGILRAWRAASGLVSVDMGAVRTGWEDVPLAQPLDTLHVALGVAGLDEAVCHSMGNPHAVVFVENAEEIDLATLGPQVEMSPLFPERVNLSVVSRIGDDRFRMRVWERGVGITEACGSGSCAVGVAIARRGLGGTSNSIVMDGGSVTIDWDQNSNHVVMTGPVAYVCKGTLSPHISAVLEAGDRSGAGDG